MDDAELKSPTTDVEHFLEPVSETDLEHEAEGHEPTAQDPVEEVIQADATPSNDVVHAPEGTSAGLPKTINALQKRPVTKPAGTRASLNPLTVKPGTAKPTAHSSKASITSPLSKSTSSVPARRATSTTTSKPTSTSKPVTAPTKPSTASTTMSSRPSQPSRRSSLAPPRAPSATGAPPQPKSRTATLLSSFTGAKLANEPNTSARPSVVSPAPSTGSNGRPVAASATPRPRAPIPEAVKSPPRGLRTTGSISSIREVDESKALAELQLKLKEANGIVLAKTEAVTQLENKILKLQESVEALSANVKVKDLTLEQLRQEKEASDAELATAEANSRHLTGEHTRDRNSIDALEKQLEDMKQADSRQLQKIEALQAHVGALSSEIATAEQKYESLRATSDQTSSEAAAAAQAERESFLRARADLDALTTEIDDLRTAHDVALQDAAARLSESRQRAVEVTSLTAQIEALKTEREDSANRISELEVEVLELKESRENAEDDHNQVSDRLKKVEEELMAVKRQAAEHAQAKEAENAQKVAELEQTHAEEVQRLQSELAEAVAELESLKNDLAVTQAAYEEMKKQNEVAAEEHEYQLEEAEQSYLSKHIEFSEEIRGLKADLEGQEAKYNEKVEAVKAEHGLLLQEAFGRAKDEAAEIHSQELQTLRTESEASIEQLRTAHESFVNDLQSSHQATLEGQVGALENKFSSQAVDLRATQDDLAKAKAALEASRSEVETLKVQVEDARAATSAASVSADQLAEMERLNKQVTSMQDENTMLNDVLAATRESLTEMTANHSKELEEAARGRAEEATRLRTEHEREISTLAVQKSELMLSLGDLESEIAVLQARLATAESVAPPRNNGTVLPPAGVVTKEELQKVYEAHNAKMLDQQDEHDRMVRTLKHDMETLQNRLEEVQADLARKNMEISYLEQEQDENQNSITRYVKVFGLQSLFGVVVALAVIFDFI